MGPALRWSLWIAAALAVVVVASLFYTRSVAPNVPTTGRPVPASGPVELHPAFQAGLAAAAAGRLDEARARFSEVPLGDPSFVLAIKNRATVELRMGELAAAEATLDALTALQPDDRELHARLGELRFRLGRYEDAELSALRALEIDPGMDEQRLAVGLYRTAEEQLAGAIQIYERVLGTTADRERIMSALGQLIEFHDEHPDAVAVHYVLAFFAHKLGRDELELEELRHYLAAEPSGPAVALARRRLHEMGPEATVD